MKHLTSGMVCLLLFAGGTSVDAQELASSFEQLAVLVKPGDKITVVDVAGRETKGRIGKLSPDALILITSTRSRQLDKLEVAAITQRRDDSLKNGAIIGAIVGAVGLGAFGAFICNLYQEEGGASCLPDTLRVAAIGAAIGAGIGVAVDAALTRHAGVTVRISVKF